LQEACNAYPTHSLIFLIHPNPARFSCQRNQISCRRLCGRIYIAQECHNSLVKFGALFSSPGSQMLGKEEGYYEKEGHSKKYA